MRDRNMAPDEVKSHNGAAVRQDEVHAAASQGEEDVNSEHEHSGAACGGNSMPHSDKPQFSKAIREAAVSIRRLRLPIADTCWRNVITWGDVPEVSTLLSQLPPQKRTAWDVVDTVSPKQLDALRKRETQKLLRCMALTFTMILNPLDHGDINNGPEKSDGGTGGGAARTDRDKFDSQVHAELSNVKCNFIIISENGSSILNKTMMLNPQTVTGEVQLQAAGEVQLQHSYRRTVVNNL
ncbi:hypothetical protein JKP88DRAFT_253982 [Tribonema minus]|uniref:Uncharacterized protein n=1 Tax=Tribonema minus TaxID=303371 RepID=A0A835Z8I6_9STRA|nr:hypothetical protein JKP88DRAFT_253982 [Tribonema minus]